MDNTSNFDALLSVYVILRQFTADLREKCHKMPVFIESLRVYGSGDPCPYPGLLPRPSSIINDSHQFALIRSKSHRKHIKIVRRQPARHSSGRRREHPSKAELAAPSRCAKAGPRLAAAGGSYPQLSAKFDFFGKGRARRSAAGGAMRPASRNLTSWQRSGGNWRSPAV